ncbi:MAG: hypothetical protein COC01_04440 [Bacteroidetes bacterium]|nr:GIY-YIG nuclease family protein [Bacteroidia bacterium]MBN4052441.1 GIY-YIG nuclease family protein [Sphingobacteriaceae bacterium AH-315-L07]PCH68079.1 MAG: hypothetical protein COC01_04440 [Bacteroidota bacterium]
MLNYTVYILKCNDQTYYTGITNDIERRIDEHETGQNEQCYTFSRRPLELLFTEHFSTPIQAIEFEKQIKGWSRKKKEALINNSWEQLPEFSKCLNETSHKNFK